MTREHEYLLYPLDTGEDPVCVRCGQVIRLDTHEARSGKPDLLSFRCSQCGWSEKFISDEE